MDDGTGGSWVSGWGAREKRHGRQYTTLQTLLSGVPDASALVKLDVEMQEWSVLWSLGADDFKRTTGNA